MRFALHNADERLFVVERRCFLGSIDRWIVPAAPVPLTTLIDEFVRHLGQGRVFDRIRRACDSTEAFTIIPMDNASTLAVCSVPTRRKAC